MIFSDNIYYHYHIRCDVLSSRTKMILDRENKSAFKFGYKTKKIQIPIYVKDIGVVHRKKFKTKKQALEYCQKLIEQGFLKQRIPCGYSSNRRLIKNKNLRIEKWKRFKFNPDPKKYVTNLLPTKEEKISEFKVAQ